MLGGAKTAKKVKAKRGRAVSFKNPRANLIRNLKIIGDDLNISKEDPVEYLEKVVKLLNAVLRKYRMELNSGANQEESTEISLFVYNLYESMKVAVATSFSSVPAFENINMGNSNNSDNLGNLIRGLKGVNLRR
jgi:hypothetical protein